MEPSIATPEEVLAFWLEESGPDKWYAGGEAFDALCRDRLAATWDAACAGQLGHWANSARGALALLIVADQIPRNIFRGDPRSFATDALARRVTSRAIDRGFDLETPEPARQFFYLPFEHSEVLADQDRAVWLIAERMAAPDTLLHARVHRHIIRTLGRFPYRNEALSRRTTDTEQAFLDEGGYGAVLRSLQGEAA